MTTVFEPSKKKLNVTEEEEQSENSDNMEIEQEDDESASENVGESSEVEENSTDEDVNKESSENEESASGEDSNDSSADKEGDDNVKGNPCWADAMRKILNTSKPKRKKTIVLSRAKKLIDIKPKEETEGEDGQEKKKWKKRDSLGIRIQPSQMNITHEKNLKRIATEGVVRVFKAAEQYQKEIEDKLVQAGPLERKREKALKSIDRKAFLDVLMGGTSKLIPADNENDDLEVKDEDDEDGVDDTNATDKKVWNVLQDSYGMGAKLKDWDKQDTDNEDSSAPEEMDSD